MFSFLQDPKEYTNNQWIKISFNFNTNVILIKLKDFEAPLLSELTEMINNWIENRTTRFGEQFKYINIKYNYESHLQSNEEYLAGSESSYTAILIYENKNNNSHMDSDGIIDD